MTPEELVRAVLRAYFDDPHGFDDLSKGRRAAAVKAAEEAIRLSNEIITREVLRLRVHRDLAEENIRLVHELARRP